VEVIEDTKIHNNVDRLILPGVGSFSELSRELSENIKIEICSFAAKEKPLLGICLGAQILFTRSFENGKHDGLNIIKGDVKNITDINKSKYSKIPNIGWFPIHFKDHSVFRNIKNNSEMYFIHSYNFVPDDKNAIFAKIVDSPINAACIQENVIAVQFHPEKSGNTGLKFLENFSSIS
jgi:glutamine amidotransferase